MIAGNVSVRTQTRENHGAVSIEMLLACGEVKVQASGARHAPVNFSGQVDIDAAEGIHNIHEGLQVDRRGMVHARAKIMFEG